MLQILSVTDITEQIKSKLENEIPDLLVRGEISECKFHSSGHIYLILKDAGAILPAVIWKSAAQKLSVIPAPGMDVIVYGRLSVYAPHGRYQFSIQSLQDAGRGELYRKFEALKKKLIEEGLCDRERKKTIPPYPLHIGLVTSETAAALQDMLRIFAHEAPHLRLSLALARVQGKGTAESLIRALDLLIPLKPDCVILARGGGSIEDLWEFNDEGLARYIADYPIPIITGIGHETDNSIADFVSDHRASTPTNAAEFICKSWREVKITLNVLVDRLYTQVDFYLDRENTRLQQVQKILSLHSPHKMVQDQEQKLKDLLERSKISILSILRFQEQKLADLLKRSKISIPSILRFQEQNIDMNTQRLSRAFRERLRYTFLKHEGLEAKLRAYAPELVLRRGYVLLRDKEKKLIRSVRELQQGKAVQLELHDGSAQAAIKEIEIKEKKNG